MAWFHSWCPPTTATSGHLVPNQAIWDGEDPAHNRRFRIFVQWIQNKYSTWNQHSKCTARLNTLCKSLKYLKYLKTAFAPHLKCTSMKHFATKCHNVVLMYFVAVFLFHLHLWNPTQVSFQIIASPNPRACSRRTLHLRPAPPHRPFHVPFAAKWWLESGANRWSPWVLVYSSSSCRCSLQLLFLLLLLLETNVFLNQTFQTRWRLSCDSKQAALENFK